MNCARNHIIAILLAATSTTCVLAQPKGPGPQPKAKQPDQVIERPIPDAAGAVPGPQDVPSKDDRRREREWRNSQTLWGPGSQPPQAPGGNPLEMLQRRMHELQQQQEQLAREYQAAAAATQRGQSMPGGFGPNPGSGPMGGPGFDPNPERMNFAAPLPEDATLKAFALKYVRPEEIAGVLRNITGGGGPRIAIDQRTNALLLAGNDKQLSVAEQLVQTLDQPGKSQQNKATETLQLRIVWLIDGLPDTVGKVPSESITNPQVLDALDKLGFESTRVVCQQLTTLTLQDNHRGEFHFEVPVLVEGQPWQFRGRGTVMPMADDRYALEFDLYVQQPNNPQNSQLGGSIFTPLNHYTVMGTTTFVAATVSGFGGAAPGQPEQHLSAFVVYLERTPEFAASPPPANSKGR